MSVSFTIPGPPVGKGRPRLNRYTGSVYTPEETRTYERQIQRIATEAMRGHTLFVSGTGVSAYVVVRLRVPDTWPKARRLAALYGDHAACKAPDCDNVQKAIFDACNGIVYDDDKQICKVDFTRIYSDASSVEVSFSEFKGAMA